MCPRNPWCEPDPNSSTPLTTTYTYDADGNVISVIDPNGNETDYTYDILGQLSTVTQPAVGGSRAVTTYAYDNLGELIQTINPTDKATYYYYNVLGQLILEDYPSDDGGRTDPSTATTYDALGNVLTTRSSGDTVPNYELAKGRRKRRV